MVGGAPAPPRPRLYLHAALSLARRAPPPHPRPYYPCEPRPFAAGVSRAPPPPSSFRGVSSPPPRETVLGCKNLPNSGKKGFEVPSITFWGVSSCPPPQPEAQEYFDTQPQNVVREGGVSPKRGWGRVSRLHPPKWRFGESFKAPHHNRFWGCFDRPPPPDTRVPQGHSGADPFKGTLMSMAKPRPQQALPPNKPHPYC